MKSNGKLPDMCWVLSIHSLPPFYPICTPMVPTNQLCEGVREIEKSALHAQRGEDTWNKVARFSKLEYRMPGYI